MDFRAKKTELPESLEEIQRHYHDRGWTDGLPIIPPTEERVEQFLSLSEIPAESIVAQVPPSGSFVTGENVAINAVMAGCDPSYGPVIIAALRAMCSETFRLGSLQTTTHPVAPLVIINGPIRQKLQVNCGTGAFGPGHRANATIGRAIRLVLMNVGGARPGAVDRSTQGQPSKYTFCVGENEEASPWEPLHQERGFDRDSDAVTVFAGENPHNVNDHRSSSAEDLLKTFAATMATAGCNNVLAGGEVLIVFGPEHAANIARSGFTKDDVRNFLFEHAVIDEARISKPNWEVLRWREGTSKVLLVDDPQKFLIMVAGGSGRHSLWLPSFGKVTASVTEPVVGSLAVSCAC